MTKKEVLEKAIQKAIDGGWEPWFEWPYSGEIDEEGLGYDNEYGYITEAATESVIFNHDFAKALWGEESKLIASKVAKRKEGGYEVEGLVTIKNWRTHLQQMVIAEDPIKYLGENI